MLQLQTDTERDLWSRVYAARASIVYQAPRATWQSENCAKSADLAVESFRKRNNA